MLDEYILIEELARLLYSFSINCDVSIVDRARINNNLNDEKQQEDQITNLREEPIRFHSEFVFITGVRGGWFVIVLGKRFVLGFRGRKTWMCTHLRDYPRFRKGLGTRSRGLEHYQALFFNRFNSVYSSLSLSPQFRLAYQPSPIYPTLQQYSSLLISAGILQCTLSLILHTINTMFLSIIVENDSVSTIRC